MHALCSYMLMRDGPVPSMPISGHMRSAQPMIFSMSRPCCQPRRYHYNFLPLPPFTMTTRTGITLAALFMFCNPICRWAKAEISGQTGQELPFTLGAHPHIHRQSLYACHLPLAWSHHSSISKWTQCSKHCDQHSDTNSQSRSGKAAVIS